MNALCIEHCQSPTPIRVEWRSLQRCCPRLFCPERTSYSGNGTPVIDPRVRHGGASTIALAERTQPEDATAAPFYPDHLLLPASPANGNKGLVCQALSKRLTVQPSLCFFEAEKEADMFLTGRFRFRRTLFGRVLLQVEEERKPRWSLSRNRPGRLRWRKARVMDLVRPELRALVDLLNRQAISLRHQPPTSPSAAPISAPASASVRRSSPLPKPANAHVLSAGG